MIKLNLGSGAQRVPGFLNVDISDHFKPDFVHDLETFPYPFEDNSVELILMSHVLEHLGQKPETYINVFKELYRVCCDKAELHIKVPHPRHDDFIADPTHVRPITPFGLTIFSKPLNERWVLEGAANTPLALMHNIDIRVEFVNFTLEQKYIDQKERGEITENELQELIQTSFNIVKEQEIRMRVHKK